MARNQGRRSNGEGSVFWDEKNRRYRAQIIVGRDTESGKLIRRSVSAKTKKEVLKKLREAQDAYADSSTEKDVTAKKNWMMGEWLDEYMTCYKRYEIKPKTYESYYGVIERYIRPEFGLREISNLSTSDIQRMINKMHDKGLAYRTIKYTVVVLKAALEKGVELDIIDKNITKGVVLPRKETKERRFLSLEEQKRFVKACNETERGIIFLVMLATGLRRGEILGLRNEDVNLNSKELRVVQTIQRVKNFDAKEGEPKTHLIIGTPKSKTSERTIPLNDILVEQLREYRSMQAKQREKMEKIGHYYNQYNLFFCSENGTPIEPRNLRRDFDKILKKAEIEGVSLHGLRHTFATRLLIDKKTDPKTVQELLGHSDTSTTLNIYVHSSQKDKVNATSLLEEYFTIE